MGIVPSGAETVTIGLGVREGVGMNPELVEDEEGLFCIGAGLRDMLLLRVSVG